MYARRALRGNTRMPRHFAYSAPVLGAAVLSALLFTVLPSVLYAVYTGANAAPLYLNNVFLDGMLGWFELIFGVVVASLLGATLLGACIAACCVVGMRTGSPNPRPWTLAECASASFSLLSLGTSIVNFVIGGYYAYALATWPAAAVPLDPAPHSDELPWAWFFVFWRIGGGLVALVLAIVLLYMLWAFYTGTGSPTYDPMTSEAAFSAAQDPPAYRPTISGSAYPRAMVAEAHNKGQVWLGEMYEQ